MTNYTDQSAESRAKKRAASEHLGPAPDGAMFLTVGDAFLARRARAPATDLYAERFWNGHGMQVSGYWLDPEILARVQTDAEVTKHTRETARFKTQDLVINKAVLELNEQFPSIPVADAKRIIGTFVPKSGRVGRAANLELEEKVRLATIAYIRHTHTDYESKLRS